MIIAQINRSRFAPPALRDDFLRKGDDSEMPQEITPWIVVGPKVRSGKPAIQGTRVPVELVIGKLAGGMTPEQVAQEYELELDDIKAALSYAANVLASEEIRGVS